MRTPTLLLPTLLLSLAACGGGQSVQELQSAGIDKISLGEFEDAASLLEQAMVMNEDPALEAELGKDLASAQAHIDPVASVSGFLELAEAYPDAVEARDHVNLGRELKDLGEYQLATEVVDAGIKRFGESESPELMSMMDQIVQAVQAGGSSDDVEALKSLGYIGD
jgi:tetratricopeptide (TPR) repeat protein